MGSLLELHPDRLFPADKNIRSIARNLYQEIKNLPIISPHGHTDPSWFANNTSFADAHALFIAPDHYLLRMLYSQGISLEKLGVVSKTSIGVADSRSAWRLFAEHYYLFRGTPTGLWLDHIFKDVFAMEERLSKENADHYFDHITAQLQTPEFKPRAIFDRFNMEFLATTEGATDNLEHHQKLRNCDWNGRVVTSYRPDSVVDPEHPHFKSALRIFGEITGEDITSWSGYLEAHRKRRADFIHVGATASDHGHPMPTTANLSRKQSEALFEIVIKGQADAKQAELFRAQMLTEMARMSLDDGLVMQIHPGSYRNHNPWLFENYGPDKGTDIPKRVEYTQALKPLLDAFGNDPRLTIILFTLDESNYSRELAPLAGVYPCLRLGPPWWFHDSPEGMLRFRRATTETAGFYNTVGFNDDTRALLSIPARHDMARRMDCRYLAELVSEHRLSENEAAEIAMDLAYHLPKKNYRID